MWTKWHSLKSRAPSFFCFFSVSAASLLAAGELEQLEYAILELIMTIDSGKDADGEATGGAGDGSITPDELANRVYVTL